MGVILWIIFGALAGWVASIVTGNNESQGAVGNVIVGIIGALLGGLVMWVLGFSGITGFDLRSFIVAVAGAVLFLWLVNSLGNRRNTI